MKLTLTLLFIAASAIAAIAQVQMTPAYSAYTSITHDWSTGKTYSTIYGSGTAYGYCNGLGCSSIFHSLSSTNQMSGPSGRNPSPNAYTQGPPFNYLTLNNTQSMPQGNQDVESIYADLQARCSYLGYLQGFTFRITVAIKVATYELGTVNGDGSATYNLACPNGNQNCTCGTAHLLGSQVHLWAEEFSLFTNPGGCWFLHLIQYKDGPPAPYPCS